MAAIRFFNELTGSDCCGPCDGGKCPVPDACERAEAEGDPLAIWQGLTLAVAISSLLWACILAAAPMVRAVFA